MHTIQIRIYYEDVDLAGIVYYANYFRFIERGRTEMLRHIGIEQGELRDRSGLVFVVRKIMAEFFRPACFDDVITVETRVSSCSGVRVVMIQTITRDDETLFAADVELAAVSESGHPKRLPTDVASNLRESSR